MATNLRRYSVRLGTSKRKKRIATEWCVMEGEPSWHQRRAGHTHAAITCYWSKKDAVAYMKRIKRKRPNESLRLVSDRKFRFYP